METMNHNNMLDAKPESLCSHSGRPQSSENPGLSTHETSANNQLTSLSFTTELSVRDINRLLKIVSVNDLP
ncbi:MAG: hypothetical protein HQL77_14250 [Magnetococcales bacterium]|nr:hypothetical protein [Magnetococcales bacterium]